MTAPVIRVVAGLVVADDGRMLLVRKRGTNRFMQAGGKPEAGESASEALVRELQEELAVAVAPADLHDLGDFTTAAANEPGHALEARVFRLRLEPGDVAGPQAEIEEARWATRAQAEALGDRLAPLARLLLAHA